MITVIVAIIYDLLFVIPMSVAASLYAGPYIAPDISPLHCLVIAVAVEIYAVLITHLKLRDRLIAGGIGLTVLLALIFYHPAGERVDFLIRYLWVWKIIALAVICYLINRISQKYPFTRLIIAVAGLICLPVSLIYPFIREKITVIMIFAYALMTVTDTVQRRSHKEGDTDVTVHLVFTAPFLLLVIIAAGLIKMPDKPYDWGFVKRISGAIRTGYARLNDVLTISGWESDEPPIGFSGRGSFGGNVRGGGYPVLSVRASGHADPYLYLKGKVYNEFDGHEWTMTTDDTEAQNRIDALTTYAALLGLSERENIPIEDILRREAVTIENESKKLDVLFCPSKLVSMNMNGSNIARYVYFRLNTRATVLMQLYEESPEIEKSYWDQACRECILDTKAAPDYDTYVSYRQKVYEDYLPTTVISDRLRTYMDELLDGADSDYEKILRMENMLRTYRYTDHPGNLPGDLSCAADYLDYFVFEKKEGYCSYYATALTLLSRAYGVPSRYVQGFRADTGHELQYKVNSSEAHAWTECYIDGIGWTVFEATPGYRGVIGTSGWMIDSKDNNAQTVMDVSEPEHMQPESDEELTDKEDARTAIPWKRMAIPVIIGIAFTLLILLFDSYLRKRRYDKLDDRGKALWICARSLHLLKRAGAGIGDSETLTEYRERLGCRISGEYVMFCDIYERLIYSCYVITPDDRAALERNLEMLKKNLKSIKRLVKCK